MKFIKQQNLINILVCLTIVLIFSQIVKAEHLPVKIYTSADGLGSSFIDFLMRDSNGFMWFCTRDGLSRFDGSQFITYKIGGKNAAPGVESIFESKTGVYWVSTTGGTYYFDSKSIPQTNASNKNRPILDAKYAGDYRGYFFEDRDGNFWLGTNGLLKVEKNNDQISFKEVDLHLSEKYKRGFGINEIKQAEDGSLWLTSNYGLMRRLPDGRVILYANEKPANTSLLLDKNGRVWLARGKVFQVLIPETIAELSNLGQFTDLSPKPTTILPLKSDGEIEFPNKIGDIFQFTNGKDSYLNSAANRLFQTVDGVIWLTIDNGLYEFKQNKVHFYSTKQGLPPSLMRMEEDSAGNLWIGGQSGLTRLDRKGLITFGLEDGLNSRNIFAITQSPEGKLYFANGDFYLSEFNGNSFQTVRPHLASDVRRVWTSRYAFNDSHGEWWILTALGLYRFAAVQNFSTLEGKDALAIYGTKTGLISDEMFQIFEDSRGTIWLSMQPTKLEGRGLARFNREEGKFEQVSESEGFPVGKSAGSFAEDKDGSLWFGFYEGGLAHYKDGKFTVFSLDSDIPNGLVTDLLFDRQGRLWIASALGGLFRLDDTGSDQFQPVRMSIENGLTSNNVRTITEDKFGNIYAGTVRGVDRISPDTKHIKHYSVSDGLAADFVVDSLCDKDGNLWFATTNGLSKLIPTQDEKPFAPSIRLGGVSIAGQEQNISTVGNTEFGNVELSSTQNNLQIEFFGLDFRAGETLRYQYKLESADADWSAPTEQRTVNFANLSPGSYRFLVRAINSEGVTSETPAVVSFKILPPIYARWWFITLCILLVSAIVFAFYRYRLARLREVNLALEEAKKAEVRLSNSRAERIIELERVRSRIATDLHDDIGASLTQIAILSEVAQAQSKGNGATDSLTKITNVSNELVGTMSDIVWSINPSKDHLSDLTQRMRRFASDSLSAKGIIFHFNSTEVDQEIVVKSNLRREVFLIFKESINNIVKHSQAKHVEIILQISDEDLTLKIVDDGKGFESDKVYENSLSSISMGKNGILSIKKRAEEMNGELEVISAIGKGTTIELKLPMEIGQTQIPNKTF